MRYVSWACDKEYGAKFYLDGMEVEGWTDGQKLTDSQWEQAVEKLRDDLATDLFENWDGDDCIIKQFFEEMLKTNNKDK